MIDKEYYNLMLDKGRLYPIKINGRLVCLFTFYIGNVDDLDNFIDTDPWKVVSDKDEGSICYISQLITDKHGDNKKLSYGIWKSFKEYIRKEYPSVDYIYWVRWNKRTKKRNRFIKSIREVTK